MACNVFCLAESIVDIVAEGHNTVMTLLFPSVWAQLSRTVKEVLTTNIVKSDVCLLITFVVITTLYK